MLSTITAYMEEMHRCLRSLTDDAKALTPDSGCEIQYFGHDEKGSQYELRMGVQLSGPVRLHCSPSFDTRAEWAVVVYGDWDGRKAFRPLSMHVETLFGMLTLDVTKEEPVAHAMRLLQAFAALTIPKPVWRLVPEHLA